MNPGARDPGAEPQGPAFRMPIRGPRPGRSGLVMCPMQSRPSSPGNGPKRPFHNPPRSHQHEDDGNQERRDLLLRDPGTPCVLTFVLSPGAVQVVVPGQHDWVCRKRNSPIPRNLAVSSAERSILRGKANTKITTQKNDSPTRPWPE